MWLWSRRLTILEPSSTKLQMVVGRRRDRTTFAVDYGENMFSNRRASFISLSRKKRCPSIKFVSHGPLGCRPERSCLNNQLKVQTKMFIVALDDCKLLVLVLRCGGESDDCKVPWGMSSRASPWPRQRHRTTERYGAAHHESTRLPPGRRHQATRTDGEEGA